MEQRGPRYILQRNHAALLQTVVVQAMWRPIDLTTAKQEDTLHFSVSLLALDSSTKRYSLADTADIWKLPDRCPFTNLWTYLEQLDHGFARIMAEGTLETLARDYIDEADWASLIPMQRNVNEALNINHLPSSSLEQIVFKPTLFFFYGTLTIPEVLRRILDLAEDPILLKATTRTFKLKMWGPYPALVRPSPDDPRDAVPGVAYAVETEEHLQRLVAYEGENYGINEILIELQEPGYQALNTTYGKTFVWKGYPEELIDGIFDTAAFRSFEERV
ncbi:hypothetical protein TWF281_009040 [Arthrobotrys megalospora]